MGRFARGRRIAAIRGVAIPVRGAAIPAVAIPVRGAAIPAVATPGLAGPGVATPSAASPTVGSCGIAGARKIRRPAEPPGAPDSSTVERSTTLDTVDCRHGDFAAAGL